MSNLLSQASLVMIPSGYKEDVVYSQIPSDGSGDLSFTRASNGTRVNSAGLVEVAPWNLLQYSEQFNVSPWQSYNQGTGILPVITANDTTAPNGTTTADKVVFNTGSGTSASDISTIYQTLSSQAEGVYTASIYAKVASGTAKILLRHAGGGTYTTLNLTTEWQRFEVAETLVGSTSFSFEIGLRRGLSNEPLTSPVTCYLWGAQVNVGSAKPYFPTTDRLNVPRLTYQNGGGGCPSLLLEKQSTNLAYPSEDFSSTDWTKDNLSVTANNTTSPDGTQNADLLIPNTTSATDHRVRQFISGTGDFVFSFYAKAGGYNWVKIRIASDWANVNLSTGAVGFTSGVTPTISNMGNGWYRISILTNSPYGFAYVYPMNTNENSIDPTAWSGNGTSGVYVWGAQLEASSYPTSYIPTTSSSATRVADACYKTGISSLIGQMEGTMFVDVSGPSKTGDARYMTVSDGSASNRIVIYSTTLTSIGVYLQNSSSSSALGFNTINGRMKIAFAYKNNDLRVYLNGILKDTITSFTSSFTLNSVTVGTYEDYQVYNSLDQSINEAIIFPTALTNAEAIALTTI